MNPYRKTPMLDLTPNDVRSKRHDLPYRLRGYDPETVDSFLDLVADSMEQLIEENRILAERLANVEEQLKQYQEREQAIVQALTLAEDLREERRLQVEREAELIRSHAQQDAERVRLEAQKALEEAREELRRLQARRRQLIWSFRTFLQRELSELEVMERTLRDRGEEITEETPALPDGHRLERNGLAAHSMNASGMHVSV